MIGAALRAWIGGSATALLGIAALAQTVPPLPSDDIVVTGSRATPRAIEQAARAVTPPGDLYHTPLARFQAPVCPGVVGMSDDFATEVVARIRIIAGQARVRIAPPGRCKANLLVIFVPNGQAALQAVQRKGPWPFGAIAPAELHDLAADPALKDLAADPAPVHAWVSTEIRNRYGEALQGQDNPGEPGTLKTSDSLSRIAMTVRQDIVASVLVIDSKAVQGMPAAQIADYVAMRGLVRTRPPGQPGAVGTILSLFDKGAIPPPELTRFDRAYLRAAYGSAANIAGITKIAQVAREVKKVGEE